MKRVTSDVDWMGGTYHPPHIQHPSLLQLLLLPHQSRAFSSGGKKQRLQKAPSWVDGIRVLSEPAHDVGLQWRLRHLVS